MVVWHKVKQTLLDITITNSSLLAEVAGHIRFSESIQVEEAFSQAFGSCNVSVAASIGQGVAAAQAQSVAQVPVHLRVRTQPGLFPAERGESAFAQILLKPSPCKQHRVLFLLSTSQANVHYVDSQHSPDYSNKYRYIFFFLNKKIVKVKAADVNDCKQPIMVDVGS